MSTSNSETKRDSPIVAQLRYIDESLSRQFSLSASESSKLGFLRPHMKCLELSCHGVPWFVGCIVFMWLTNDEETHVLLCNLIYALLVDIFCVAVLKASCRRCRPNYNNPDMFMTLSVDKLSFPSGHASRAIMMSYLFRYQCSIPPLLGCFLIVWSVAVCISRVMLGRHFVADVLGGAFLGLVQFYIMQFLWMDKATALFFARRFFSIYN